MHAVVPSGTRAQPPPPIIWDLELRVAEAVLAQEVVLAETVVVPDAHYKLVSSLHISTARV